MSEVTIKTEPDLQSREERRVELTKLGKRELAEMLCSTFRPTVRPTRSQVMNAYTKSQIAEQLLDIQDRLAAQR